MNSLCFVLHTSIVSALLNTAYVILLKIAGLIAASSIEIYDDVFMLSDYFY